MDRAGATRNRWRGRVVVLVTVAAVLAMAGCEAQVTDAVNGARTTGGAAALPVTATLTTAARAHSQAMCAAGRGHARRRRRPPPTRRGPT